MVASWIARAATSTGLVSRASMNIEDPKVPLTGVNISSWFGGRGHTRSGLTVGVHDALGHSPVWAAVSIIAEDIMRLPWLTYERKQVNGRDSKERATDHPVYRLLRRETARRGEPSRMTSNLFIQRMLVHALLHGNAYARIHRVVDDGITLPYRLEWLHSDRVTPDLARGQRIYKVTYDGVHDEDMFGRVGKHQGGEVFIQDDEMFHLSGLTIDELGGLSLIAYARNSIGRQIAAEVFGEEFFRNHAVPQGFLSSPHKMNGDEWLRMKKFIEMQHGQGKWHTFGLLPDGMKYEKTGVNASDAMLLDMMKFGAPEASRWFKVPLHRLGDPSRQGYNTTEAENQSFFNSCLGNWISRLEFEANDKLFSDDEKDQDRYYTEFKVDALLKANTIDRYNAHRIAIETGIKNRNEVRAEENLNSYDGGDDFLVPLNMGSGADVNADQPDTDEPVAAEALQEDEDERKRLERSAYLRDALTDQMQKMGKRLGNAAIKAAKKPNSFLSFVNELESHREVIEDAIGPLVKYAALETRAHTPKEAIDDIVSTLFAECREAMLDAAECQPEELSARVDQAAAKLREVVIPSLVDGMLYGERSCNTTKEAVSAA